MIVYADRQHRVRTCIKETNWRDALIRFCEIEAAIADGVCSEWDEPHPLLDELRFIAVRLALGDLEALRQLPPLPPELCVSTPEGYAYYAVYPEDYGIAAENYYTSVRPQKVVVIGIRSIGTSLSAVVAATLQNLGCQVASHTVRPRGHPFSREVHMRGFSWHPDAHFAIVDEGPGLSGTSFTSVAAHLSALGIRDDRIVFFPSWDADGHSFLSASARRQWVRHRRYLAVHPQPAGAQDLSAGRWRRFCSVHTPVQPQHERRKFFRDGQLSKFEGLAQYGTHKLQRAQFLAGAGLAPPPQKLEDGYLVFPWMEGRPVNVADSTFQDWVRRYLTFLATHLPSDRPVPYDELIQMIQVNVEESLGSDWVRRADKLKRLRSEVCDRQTTQIDGRMLPHEFLRTSTGYVKTDTLDHHDDHFFPGCQDIAWDVAAASIELNTTEVDDLVSPSCLSFYKVAYLSYRLGYCIMAAQAGFDADGFHLLSAHYKDQLRHELGRLC